MKTYFGLVLLLVQVFLMRTGNATPYGENLDIGVPEECKGGGFCSVRPPGYDAIEEKINSLLPRHLIDFNMRSSETPEITSDGADNCPRKIVNGSVYYYEYENKERDIIVQTELVPQTLTEIKCAYDQMTEGLTCLNGVGLISSTMKSSCREHTTQRSLLVFDPRNSKFAMRNYTISVCCSCHVTTVL